MLTQDDIKKLRNVHEMTLTERGASEHEAEVAAAKLNKMLADRGLAITDLDSLEDAAGIVHEEFNDPLNNWKKALLYHLGLSNFCKVLVFPAEGGGERSLIVGEPQNIAVLKEMYVWLIDEFPRVTDQALEERKAWADQPEEADELSIGQYLRRQSRRYFFEDSRDMAWFAPEQWRGSYLYGLAIGLGEKLERERRPPTGLERAFALDVVRDDQHVDQYVAENFETKRVEVKEEVTAAFVEGREKGRNFPTERQVKDGATSTLEIEEQS